MKKYIALLLALSMFFGTGVFAQASSGMKDVDTITGEVTAEIKTDAFDTTWIEGDIICDDSFGYEVIVHSNSDMTEYVEIQAKCGDKEYESAELAIAPGKSVTRTGVMDNLLQGKHALEISVVKNDGAVVAQFSKTIAILYPEEDEYLQKFTRKVGLSGATTVSRYIEMEWIKLLSKRQELAWRLAEPVKGVYDVDQFDEEVDTLNSLGGDTVLLMNYNNPLYSKSDNVKKGLSSKEELDGFANYVQEMGRHYQDVTLFELSNEPNGMWQPRNTTDYAYMCELAKLKLNQVNEKGKTLIGSVAEGDYGFVEEVMEAGAYPNMDIAANHPYIRPSKVDTSYHNVLQGMNSVLTAYGGWKRQDITEIGWPTHNAGVSVEQAAIENAKQIIVADYYGVMQNQPYMIADALANWSSDNSEQNFGVLFGNQHTGLKPGAYTVSEVCAKTNGAVFCGRRVFEEYPDIEAYMYLRDGELLCIIWSKGEEYNVKFEGESLLASDMYGNPIGKGDGFTIGEEFVYLEGMNKKWLLHALSESAKQYPDIYLGRAFDKSQGKKGWEEACDILYETVDNVRILETGSYPTEEEVLAVIDRNYEIMDKIIQMYASGELDIEIEQLSGLLYVNSWIVNLLDTIYILSVDEKEDYRPQSKSAIEEVQKVIKEKADEKTMTYSTAILNYAEEYSDKAYGVKDLDGTNPMKTGVVKAWDIMAIKAAELAKKITGIEVPQHHNCLLQLPSDECVIEISFNQTIRASLYNFRKTKDLTGYAEIVSPSGEVVAKSEEVTLKAGEDCYVPMDIMLPGIEEGEYKIRFYEGGECIIERPAKLKGKVVNEAKLEYTDKLFDEIETISVTCSNYNDKPLKGSVKIEPLCNWEIEAGAKEIDLEPESEVTLSWKVEKKERTSFNYYPFKVMICDEEGKTLWQQIQLLSFLVVSKSDKVMSTAAFDGNIESWEDAYPLYLSIPENPDDEEMWHDGDYYNRMMMKWDDKNYYILVDVYDWYHENYQAGASIWNADALQVSFDPLNNGNPDEPLYDSDDFEFGFALTEAKGNTVYAWADAVTGKAGDKPGEWVSIIRNEDLSMTRYFAAIPKESLAPLTFAEGTKFGFNICYNNSNVGTRAEFQQITPGTADMGKRPGLYKRFYLREDIKDTPITYLKNPIPNSLTGTETVSGEEKSFNDIQNHWAKEDISSMARSGYVSGYEDGSFKPDNNITRAEFVIILMGMDKRVLTTKAHYRDVDMWQWYSPYISRATRLNLIPPELVENEYFYPDNPITREEAFAILHLWHKDVKKKDGEYKPLYKFEDCNEISDWAAEAFQNLYNNDIISGDGSMLKPHDTITRAEAVSVLKRAYTN